MKIYKLEVIIIDHDGLGEKGIADLIKHTHYANHAINPIVYKIDERDIGAWSDEHPLNSLWTMHDEIKRLF